MMVSTLTLQLILSINSFVVVVVGINVVYIIFAVGWLSEAEGERAVSDGLGGDEK